MWIIIKHHNSVLAIIEQDESSLATSNNPSIGITKEEIQRIISKPKPQTKLGNPTSTLKAKLLQKYGGDPLKELHIKKLEILKVNERSQSIVLNLPIYNKYIYIYIQEI